MVLDERERAGGMLRYGVPDDRLDRRVLDAEVGILAKLGVAFRPTVHVEAVASLLAPTGPYDAVVLAAGPIGAAGASALGLAASKLGVEADAHTFATSVRGVFAAGACVHPGHPAVRAVGDGKSAAISVDQYLRGADPSGPHRLFNCAVGRLRDGEMGEFLKEADGRARVAPSGEPGAGFSAQEALHEAQRCLHCDCRKNESCLLRKHSDTYGARRQRYAGESRDRVERIFQHGEVVYEPGKCIKCGRCVRITESAREPLGLTFVGRGFTVCVGVPFGEPLDRALRTTGARCVEACPTGSLAFRTGEDQAKENGP